MKKVICSMMAIALVGGMLSGCGKTNDNPSGG